jgi:hypothetical protein
MGGRALQKYGIETERKDSKEFYEIASKIGIQLNYGLGLTTSVPVEFVYSPSIQSQSVRCYRTKQDHGDLDVLIKVDQDFINNGVNLKEYIEEHFKPQVVHSNGGVLSFDYENFQIDFIPIAESNWEVAQVYFSFDPLGNAMGKTFHKMNLSYGWDGLKFKYRNFNGRNSHDIEITKDPRKIFAFGGYDYDRYLKGFATIEEIFEFIIAGSYFDAEMFKMENLNHIDRKRNRKRGSYHAFLEYVEKNAPTQSYEFKDKPYYAPRINDFFPEANFFVTLENLDEKNAIDARLNEKFNGRLVMTWIPSLSGKSLGLALNYFKLDLGENYQEIILESTEEQIKKRFMKFYEQKK